MSVENLVMQVSDNLMQQENKVVNELFVVRRELEQLGYFPIFEIESYPIESEMTSDFTMRFIQEKRYKITIQDKEFYFIKDSKTTLSNILKELQEQI